MLDPNLATANPIGVYHYKARVYDPVLGRFLQTDPVGYGEDLNLYAYVRNDPLNGTDPLGRESCPTGETCPDIPPMPTEVSGEAIDAANAMSVAAGTAETGVRILVDPNDPTRVTEVRVGPAAGRPDDDNPMRFTFNPRREGERIGADVHPHPRQGERGERDPAIRASNDRVNERNMYPSAGDFRAMNRTGAPMVLKNPSGAVLEVYRIDNVDHIRVLVPGTQPLGPVPDTLTNVVVDQ